MPTGTPLPESVTLERDARLLRESFTRCRRDVSCPQTDAHVRNLIKRVEHGRVLLAEHMVTLAWDAFHRGAPQHHVEEPGHEYVTIVRTWFAARERGESVPVPEILRRAIEAQSAAVNAEAAALAMLCPKTLGDAKDAARRAIVELEHEIEAIDDRQFAGKQAA